MKTKCLIVDDEDLALNIIEDYIGRIDELELVGRANNAIDAFNILRKVKVDLLFLDIQMPRLNGIDFLKSLSSPPRVIITSAFPSYAIDGYELNVSSFLLKPISFDKFLKAINKVQEQLRQPVASHQTQEATISSHYDEAFIYVKLDKIMVKIFMKDIFYIESAGNYVKIKTSSQDITTYCSISGIEDKLPKSKFLRIHKSYIVALDKINSFSAAFVTFSALKIPIGRNYKNEVMKILSKDSVNMSFT